jgi:2-(1,2-epoxy-1,2-dihydrophenyl)acetyl-CoA isomerase
VHVTAVETDDKNGVRWIFLNRPESLNAIDLEIRTSLPDALTAASADDSVKAVVLTGRGRAFCAGGDVKLMGNRSTETLLKSMLRTKAIITAIVECEKPVIAALNGLAVGAGASIALASDLVVAVPEAWMAFVFVERGLIPDMAATYFLPRIVGVSRAKEIMMTGRRIPADEAHRLGLIAELIPQHAFEQDVQRLAESFTALNRSVVPYIRHLVNSSLETDLSTAMNLEAFGQTVVSTFDGHKQAIADFAAKPKG